MNTVTVTVTPGLMKLLQAALTLVLVGEQSAAQITLTSNDGQDVELVLVGEVSNGGF